MSLSDSVGVLVILRIFLHLAESTPIPSEATSSNPSPRTSTRHIAYSQRPHRTACQERQSLPVTSPARQTVLAHRATGRPPGHTASSQHSTGDSVTTVVRTLTQLHPTL
ncbi:hypothetical protein C8Q76DRAFT_736614 [Earliella scabrosa]|nr:hypothetical protein C8Q76DRAFT_736614 [Earliella scabrosa]